jgi:uncharacterized integral membrane protein
MKQFLKLLQWTLNAAVFFTLFAFALNNQHEAKVYFFFGTQWRSPMVLIVLTAFALGLVVGVLGMVPRWWRQKQAAKTVQANTGSATNPDLPEAPHGTGPHMDFGGIASRIWLGLVGLQTRFATAAHRQPPSASRVFQRPEFFIERATRQGH